MSLDFSDIDFNVEFRGGQDPKDIRITDVTDHAGFGTTTANTVSTLLGRLPDNTVFSNNAIGTPDFDHDVNTTKDYSLALESDGSFKKGTYTFAMEYLFSSYSFSLTSIGVDTSLVSSPYDIIYFDGDIRSYFDGLTELTIDNGIGLATIDSVTYDPITNRTSLSQVETLVDGTIYTVTFTNDLSYTKTKTVNMQFSEPQGDITVSYSTYKATMTVKDSTVYDGSVVDSRALVIKYPDLIDPAVADVSTTEDSKTITTLYTGGYEISLDVSATKTLSTGFTYTFDIDVSEAVVVKEINLHCDIKCALKELRDKFKAEKGGGSLVVAGKYQLVITEVNLGLDLYRSYMECGDYEDAEVLASEIKSTLDRCGCTCTDCDEVDALPKLLTPKE